MTLQVRILQFKNNYSAKADRVVFSFVVILHVILSVSRITHNSGIKHGRHGKSVNL